ncbi:MAG: hypothetical protein HZB67_02715 [Candidatus Aenigmarchaeota archaeon]|nr:hypothetical protein [Candidatus Aenigmarchaeota archaeon]
MEKSAKRGVSPNGRRSPPMHPHPMAVYTVIAIAVFLSLTILTKTNVDAMATAIGDIPNTKLVYTGATFCSELCQPLNEYQRLGMYAINPDNPQILECISIDRYVNERRCCSDYECPSGYDCVNGICG